MSIKYIVLFLIQISVSNCFCQKNESDLFLKFSNIAISDRETIAKIEDEEIPFYPSEENAGLGIKSEFLFAKYNKKNIGYILSASYTKFKSTNKRNTFRDTTKFVSSTFLNNDNVGVGIGGVHKIKVNNLPLFGIVSAKIIGQYSFNSINKSETILTTLENEFIAKGIREVRNPSQLNLGFELDFGIFYKLGSRFSIGINVSNSYLLRHSNGIQTDDTTIYDDKMNIERETNISRNERRLFFFDATTFSLTFIYSISK